MNSMFSEKALFSKEVKVLSKLTFNQVLMTPLMGNRILILVLITCLLLGCAIGRRPVVVVPMDIYGILATLKSRYDLTNNMRTLVALKLESKGRSGEIRGILNYEKPDKISFYALGPFNDPKVITIVKGNSLQIYLVSENELIEGELDDEVIKDVFDIDLRISDIKSSIFANPLLDSDGKDLELELREGEYLITKVSEEYKQEIYIDPQNITVRKWMISDPNGELVQEIIFSKYEKIKGMLRPLKVQITRPNSNFKVSIESINPEMNVKLSPKAFTISLPKNIKVTKLSESKGTLVY